MSRAYLLDPPKGRPHSPGCTDGLLRDFPAAVQSLDCSFAWPARNCPVPIPSFHQKVMPAWGKIRQNYEIYFVIFSKIMLFRV